YLDAIRGVAALAVVVWHWQHFMLLEGSKFSWPPASGEPTRTGEPFYFLLKPLYEAGFIAVDLFFVISGFVFFLLYDTSIARRQTTASRFFIYRFSRLYPLYSITLIMAALLEALFIVRTGQPFVSGQADSLPFAKNLLLVHAP